MQPVVPPEAMREVDRAAGRRLSELVEKAGWEVYRAARSTLGGTYGRRVAVIAGKGNNGADGRVAARHLKRAGARVDLVAPGPGDLRHYDLVVDAAFGTGFRGGYRPPEVGSVPVLAVDIPSGLDGLTGENRGALVATETVTFGALKPGLLLGDGPDVCGRILVRGLGLDLGPADVDTWRPGPEDVSIHWPRRSRRAHKWSRAVRVVAGSEGMEGAGVLCARSAYRAGAGMVVVSGRGRGPWPHEPVEAVRRSLSPQGWVDQVLSDIGRFRALVVGPGLGRDPATAEGIRELVEGCPVPVVADADALRALDLDRLGTREGGVVVLTPHEGEFEALTGEGGGANPLDRAREASRRGRCTVLLKGAPTVIAGPDGRALIVDSGDRRLATAGSGDVLAGIIGAVLDGSDPLPQVGVAAWLHGFLSSVGPAHGIVAGDLVELIPTALSQLLEGGPGRTPPRSGSCRRPTALSQLLEGGPP